MQEHPIPQDVTGYKFHIVGNMTIGQFMQVAAGAVVAFIIYSTNLYDIVKWPLVLFAFGLGAMIAFIPIGERPISHWLTTFARILYKPTQFYWRRDPVVPDFFNFVSSSSQTVVLPELDLSPLRRQKIHEYIVSAKVVDTPDQENQQVQSYVDHISTLFSSTTQQAQNSDVVLTVHRPNLKVRLRSMRSQPSSPLNQEVAMSQPDDAVNDVMGQVVPTNPTEITSDAIQPNVVANANQTSATAFTQNRTTVELSTARSEQNGSASGVDIPQEKLPQIEPDAIQANAEVSPQQTSQAPTFIQPVEIQLAQNVADQSATDVTFNKQLPFPSKPTIPNKLVGMVLSAKNDLLEGAIVEIHAQDGAVARAVRSNALGQFFVTTPLKSDNYIINVEKEGYTFEPLSIKLSGKIVDPIEIHSA